MNTKSIPDLIRAVQVFVQSDLKYLRESPETFASPMRTLEWGVGDCDDFTILVGSMLRGIKIPVRVAFVGWQKEKPTKPIPFQHVYPLAFDKARWRAVETVKETPYGWDAASDKLRQGYYVRRVTLGDPTPRVKK